MRSVSLRLCLAIVTLAAPLHAGDRIFDAPMGRSCFVELLRTAAWGLAGPWERAAFVVQSADEIDCVRWPSKHLYLEETFHGAMPANTIALVHTHPAAFPTPSDADVAEATRIGKPIYVVSIRGVYRIDRRNGAISRIAEGLSWIDNVPGSAIARNHRSP